MDLGQHKPFGNLEAFNGYVNANIVKVIFLVKPGEVSGIGFREDFELLQERTCAFR